MPHPVHDASLQYNFLEMLSEKYHVDLIVREGWMCSPILVVYQWHDVIVHRTQSDSCLPSGTSPPTASQSTRR